MIETGERLPKETLVADIRAEIASANSRADGVVPTLRHYLANENKALFGDAIIAQVRGMQAHLVDQLTPRGETNASQGENLQFAIADNAILLSHLHGLALEWQLTGLLESEFSINPVNSSLLAGLVTSTSELEQDLAGQFLTAQSRWHQSQQRMQIDVSQLPDDVFEDVMSILGGSGIPQAAAHEKKFRATYDEATSRLGLSARIVMGLDGDGTSALDLQACGVAFFATALALGSGLSREQAIVAMRDPQGIRLAVALRSAGASLALIEQQTLLLHGEVILPKGLEDISAADARALLNTMFEQGR